MAFGAQMVELGLPQIVQSLKAQAWSDEVREFCLLLLSFSFFVVFQLYICYYESIEQSTIILTLISIDW